MLCQSITIAVGTDCGLAFEVAEARKPDALSVTSSVESALPALALVVAVARFDANSGPCLAAPLAELSFHHCIFCIQEAIIIMITIKHKTHSIVIHWLCWGNGTNKQIINQLDFIIHTSG